MGSRSRLKGVKMSQKSNFGPRPKISTDSPKPNFAESMAKAAKAVKASAQKQDAQIDPNAISTTKPDTQEINDSVITWEWDKENFTVIAHYFRQENAFGFDAGDYVVDIVNLAVALDPWNNMDPELVKELAQLLLSAYQWASVWQQYMGEFFASAPKEPQIVNPTDYGTDLIVDKEVKTTMFRTPVPAPKKKVAKKTTDAQES